MRMLDRYVIRQFLKTVAFALMAFSLIFIIVDLIEKLDDFIDQNVSTMIIVSYYAYFLPRILGLMVPVAMLLASLFVVGKLSNNNEYTIIKCSGVSLYRFMLPLLVLGFMVSGAMLWFEGWALPDINAGRLQLEREYLKKNLDVGNRYNLFFQTRSDRIVSLEYFNDKTNTARQVTLQQFAPEDPTVMVMRLDAEEMRWYPDGTWKLFHGVRRVFSNDSAVAIDKREHIEAYDSLDLGPLVITPKVITRLQLKPEELLLTEFGEYIQRQRSAGSDVSRLLVDYHGKIAFPFANLIVVFLGVPFASVKRRSGLAVQFGISIFMLFVYLVSQKLSQVFGYSGSVHPLLAAWMPNLLFLLAGITIMLRVRK